MSKLALFFAVVTVAMASASANAASLSFVYTGPGVVNDDGAVVAALGDLLSFDVVMDFSDDPTIGGGFDIVFDPGVLRYEQYLHSGFGGSVFDPGPDVQDGLLENIIFGSLSPLTGPAVVGEVSFTLIGSAASMLFLAPTDGNGGPFISSDFVTEIDVDYGHIMINTPLPAAAWFMLSAIGALGAMRRRCAV